MSRCGGCQYPDSCVVDSPERRKGAIIAVIGEGPADEERRRGMDFVGASGREMEFTLARAGIARAEVAIENAHGCQRPYADTNPGKLARAVAACRGRLAAFLEEVQPRGVVMMGGSAMRSLMPGFVSGPSSDGLMRHRGSIWSRDEVMDANAAVGEVSILPESVRYLVATIHPAAIIGRERLEKFPSMAYRTVPGLDIKRLLACVTKGRVDEPLTMRTGVPDWVDEPFIFDLETMSRRDRHIKWIGVQHAEGGDVWGAPWEWARDWARRAMGSRAVKAGHNINGFDIPVLAADGIRVSEPWEDTMSLAGICESDMARGLHFQQAFYAGDRLPFHKELTCGDWEDGDAMRATTALRAAWMRRGGIGNPVTEGMWAQTYNALDVLATGIVWRQQKLRCRQEGWE